MNTELLNAICALLLRAAEPLEMKERNTCYHAYSHIRIYQAKHGHRF
jgi:hypothetical protein